MDLALGEFWDIMLQYTNYADSLESAARKERLRQAAKQGNLEDSVV